MHFLPGKRAVLALLAVAAVILLPLAAGASTAYFDLGIPNTALSAFSSPYATVTITGGDTDTIAGPVSFEVLGLPGSRISDSVSFQFLLGGDVFGIMGLTPTAVTAFSQMGIGFDPPVFSIVANSGVGDFGKFTNVIQNINGFKNAVSSFTFSVSEQFDDANAALAFLQTLSNLNNKGYFAAAHIFPTLNTNPIDQANGAINTGFAGNGNQGVPIPVPPTVWLLGSGLIGVGLLGWRRKKA